jgi:17beta-estradiol 17-dehydrogenase / very-long-chain 3-oxoacyl-CoA reductase
LGLLIYIIKRILAKKIILIERYGNNSWALITGAAGGLGRSYAVQLAKKGFNIIAIDHNKP